MVTTNTVASMAAPTARHLPLAWDKPMTLFDRYPALAFVAPLAAYLAVGSLEPTPETPGGQAIGLSIDYSFYPWLYTVKLLLTAGCIAWVWPRWRGFASRVSFIGPVVGAVGAVVWIGLCELNLEQRFLVPLLSPVKLDALIAAGARPGFNPWEHWTDQPLAAAAFFAVRLAGLVLIVPLIEEFFYRGLVMRFPVEQQWWTVPEGQSNRAGIVLSVVLPLAMHPGELAAALAWFSLIAWLYLYSRRVWDCVVAHAVTNLLLGLYVLATGHWRLL